MFSRKACKDAKKTLYPYCHAILSNPIYSFIKFLTSSVKAQGKILVLPQLDIPNWNFKSIFPIFNYENNFDFTCDKYKPKTISKIPSILGRLKNSDKIRYEKIAVNTGIRFEKTFVRPIPISRVEMVKKT